MMFLLLKNCYLKGILPELISISYEIYLIIRAIESVMQRHPEPSENGMDDAYKMTNTYRGKAIIFSHLKTPGQVQRDGNAEDVAKLSSVLDSLKFDVECEEDLKVDGIKRKLKETLKDKSYLSKSDCLMIFVLTHGYDVAQLLCSDGFYPENILWTGFSESECPELKGKPKIFIFQACRGKKIPEPFKEGVARTVETAEEIPLINESNFLFFYSTYQGDAAFRTPNGTCFIQKFCKQLERLKETEDLVSIMTQVSQKVSKKICTHEISYTACCQMPVIRSTLNKKIYFYQQSDS